MHERGGIYSSHQGPGPRIPDLHGVVIIEDRTGPGFSITHTSYEHPLAWIVPLAIFSILVGGGLLALLLWCLLRRQKVDGDVRRRRPAPAPAHQDIEGMRYDVETECVTRQNGFDGSFDPTCQSGQIDRI
ncbi:hypothetical protein RF11_09696 [Thelohanellus kitauei]|uniref:Uncharacterized protein n=1 Tax=Thelohanellus kitauei TaxID=669202 RepID=A0A0C2JM23_THEKT|nr:hypothetical protein RF11_09696 [Thelohanellus kitauei]